MQSNKLNFKVTGTDLATSLKMPAPKGEPLPNGKIQEIPLLDAEILRARADYREISKRVSGLVVWVALTLVLALVVCAIQSLARDVAARHHDLTVCILVGASSAVFCAGCFAVMLMTLAELRTALKNILADGEISRLYDAGVIVGRAQRDLREAIQAYEFPITGFEFERVAYEKGKGYSVSIAFLVQDAGGVTHKTSAGVASQGDFESILYLVPEGEGVSLNTIRYKAVGVDMNGCVRLGSAYVCFPDLCRQLEERGVPMTLFDPPMPSAPVAIAEAA